MARPGLIRQGLVHDNDELTVRFIVRVGEETAVEEGRAHRGNEITLNLDRGAEIEGSRFRGDVALSEEGGVAVVAIRGQK